MQPLVVLLLLQHPRVLRLDVVHLCPQVHHLIPLLADLCLEVPELRFNALQDGEIVSLLLDLVDFLDEKEPVGSKVTRELSLKVREGFLVIYYYL